MFRWRAVFCNRAWPSRAQRKQGRRKGTEAQKQEQMGTRKRTSRSIETLIQHSNPDNNLYTSSYTRVCYYQRESTLYYAQYELVVRIILLLEYAYYSTSICICIKYAYYPYTARQCYAYYIMYAQYPYYLSYSKRVVATTTTSRSSMHNVLLTRVVRAQQKNQSTVYEKYSYSMHRVCVLHTTLLLVRAYQLV